MALHIISGACAMSPSPCGTTIPPLAISPAVRTRRILAADPDVHRGDGNRHSWSGLVACALPAMGRRCSGTLHYMYENSLNGGDLTTLRSFWTRMKMVISPSNYIVMKEGLHFHGHIRKWYKHRGMGAGPDGDHGADGNDRTARRFETITMM